MAGSSTGTIPPTPAETALAQVGANRFQDYVQRWEPLQMHLASTIEGMGGADSWQRQEAEGKAKAEVSQQFTTAETASGAKQLSAGINVGSEKFGLTQAAMTTDQARAGGERTSQADQAITGQYLSGLTALTAIGRGQAATASQGMGVATDIGTRTAIGDAAASSAARAGNEAVLGYGLGMAGGAYMNSSSSPAGIPISDSPYSNMPQGSGYTPGQSYGIPSFTQVPMGPQGATMGSPTGP